VGKRREEERAVERGDELGKDRGEKSWGRQGQIIFTLGGGDERRQDGYLWLRTHRPDRRLSDEGSKPLAIY
jgi:hypothetical protein